MAFNAGQSPVAATPWLRTWHQQEGHSTDTHRLGQETFPHDAGDPRLLHHLGGHLLPLDRPSVKLQCPFYHDPILFTSNHGPVDRNVKLILSHGESVKVVKFYQKK